MRMPQWGRRVAVASALLFTWSCGIGADADVAARPLLRDPSVSRRHIAFSYAGCIWIANRDGSHPRRLTHQGGEGKPAFSPDGSQIAFAGRYDGIRSVYVMSASGGEPRRLTYHPADLGIGPVRDVLSWTPDGKHILFNSRRAAFIPSTVDLAISQLFTVPVAGGFVMQVPLARAAQGAFSPDGTRLAYVPNTQRHWDWKRYRGGQTTPIQIADLGDSSIRAQIPRDNSNDFNPMWVGESVYFLSDRNGPVSLFAYDVKSQKVKQMVANDGLDIKSASATADAIVYEQFGSLHVLDLESGTARSLDIRPVADLPELRPHLRHIELAQLRSASLSPDGKTALFSARGEIFTVATHAGDVRNVTSTPAAVERDPAWSPDGKSIAYFSDESGEYALHIRDAVGPGRVRKIDLGRPPAFYYSPVWSPDSTKIGYTDQRLNYWYVDLRERKPVRIDTDLFVDPKRGLRLAWSPDSRRIAYIKQLPNYLHAIFVYSLDRRQSYPITDGTSDALHVAFDKDGRHLYFTASTDMGPSASWLDMSGMQRPVTRGVYAAILKKSDGLSERIVTLPVPARNYYDLVAGKPGVIFLIEGPAIDPIQPYSPSGSGLAATVTRFDLSTRTTERVLNDLTTLQRSSKYLPAFALSFTGDRMLYLSNDRWFTSDATRWAPEALSLAGMRVWVEPRQEWAHMFHQVWRGERDFFYDPGLHGLDLQATRRQYEPWLAGVASRDDLNYLFNEMLGNLTVGHLAAFGGEAAPPRPSAVGLLGADYSVANERYRFDCIYAGDVWDTQVRAPLVDVHVGEYLIAVNGRDVRPSADVHSFFSDTAEKPVVLAISRNADGRAAREVTVTPVRDETPLRYFAWIEENRRRVDELTSGRVAYIHLPDTFARGYPSFNRHFFAQVGKEAAIIDERYNSGGVTPDYLIHYLSRPLTNYRHTRYGNVLASPQLAIFGPKVMLINEMSGSGGDNFAWQFRRAGIGPLIGKRTWGGLVGMYTVPDDLLDGGTLWTPSMAFYNPNGTWDIENHGVAPDIEVEEDPKAMREGTDLQLEKAVAVILSLLRQDPPPATPPHPPFPDYHQRRH
jgi:tricorn protease